MENLAFYKPNSGGNGGAIQFKPGYTSDDKGTRITCFFMETAPQNGEKAFDWTKKVTLKLDIEDIGKIMALFSGRVQECKLFHSSEKGGNKTLSIVKGKQYGYWVSTTSSLTQTKVDLPLADYEAEIVLSVFRTEISRLLNW